MKKLKRMRLWLADMWQPFLLGCAGVLLVIGLLGYRLGSLTGGLSESEFATQQQVQHRTLKAETILTEDPLYLPYKAGLYGLQKLHLSQPIAIRTLSVMSGFIAVFSILLILKNWHTTRVAMLTTLMFATSAWFLHSSRLIGPNSLYLLLPALILCGVLLHRGTAPRFVAICAVALAIGLLYVPGMIWIIIPGLLWQWRLIWQQLQEREAWVLTLIALLGTGFLVPLVMAAINDPSILQTLVGLPDKLPNPVDFARNLARVPWQLIARAPNNPEMNLGRLPLVDVFTGTMALLGGYAYFYRRKLDRAKLLVGVLVFGALLIALGGPVPIVILLPVVYVFAAAGITMMLQRWFTVFPRNPVARGIGIGIITTAIFASCFYNLQRYFVAWPDSPATKATFSKQI